MKQYECVQVNHHKKVAPTVEEYAQKGWCLHTYQVAGESGAVNHYLLFEKGN